MIYLDATLRVRIKSKSFQEGVNLLLNIRITILIDVDKKCYIIKGRGSNKNPKNIFMFDVYSFLLLNQNHNCNTECNINL